MEEDRQTSRKGSFAIEKQACKCNIHGQRSRGRLRMNWRTRMGEEADTNGRTWREFKAVNWKPSPLALLCGCPLLQSGVIGTESNWAFCHFITRESRWKFVRFLLFAKHELCIFSRTYLGINVSAKMCFGIHLTYTQAVMWAFLCCGL